MSELLKPRIYYRDKSVVFLKTKEQYGGLSNMASGFGLEVNKVYIPSSEALYQACRYPHLPEVQCLIVKQHSPMTAKMISKSYKNQSRPDWERIKINVMRWCLKVKLYQHWDAFSKLLLSTGDMPIVEQSHRDVFWGAKLQADETLLGINILGRLLVELRQELHDPNNRKLKILQAPEKVPGLLFFGQPFEIPTSVNSKPDNSHLEPVATTQTTMSLPVESKYFIKVKQS